MSCHEMEELIYTYREITPLQQAEVKKHIAGCASCSQLFKEVETFLEELKSSAQQPVALSSISKRVYNSISSPQKRKDTKIFSLLDLSVTRYSLAAVSIGILVLFFIEIINPDFNVKNMKGPIRNIQGAIINSDNLRKTFTETKSRTSALGDCKNFLNNSVDVNCIKEKLSKINL